MQTVGEQRRRVEASVLKLQFALEVSQEVLQLKERSCLALEGGCGPEAGRKLVFHILRSRRHARLASMLPPNFKYAALYTHSSTHTTPQQPVM